MVAWTSEPYFVFEFSLDLVTVTVDWDVFLDLVTEVREVWICLETWLSSVASEPRTTGMELIVCNYQLKNQKPDDEE